jgi:hypothetical protein
LHDTLTCSDFSSIIKDLSVCPCLTCETSELLSKAHKLLHAHLTACAHMYAWHMQASCWSWHLCCLARAAPYSMQTSRAGRCRYRPPRLQQAAMEVCHQRQQQLRRQTMTLPMAATSAFCCQTMQGTSWCEQAVDTAVQECHAVADTMLLQLWCCCCCYCCGPRGRRSTLLHSTVWQTDTCKLVDLQFFCTAFCVYWLRRYCTQVVVMTACGALELAVE